MKELPQTWTRGGFSHEVLRREGMVALVQRQHRDVSTPHWEVVRLRVKPKRLLHGHWVGESEAYPSPEEWGERGWTYTTLEDAQAKFTEMTMLKFSTRISASKFNHD